MMNIKEANEDIKMIASRNNTAIFIVGDLFNDKVKNHFHYDYQKFIDEVSRINGRDMTEELIENDFLHPLPYGEYEIDFGYDKDTAGQTIHRNNFSIISSLDDNIYILYHEAGHLLQKECNLFDDNELNRKYGQSLNSKEIFEYKRFLEEQHSESFAYAAMMLRSENAFELAKSAIKAWKRGVKKSSSAFTTVSDSYTGNNNVAFYATFPVMIQTIKECLKIKHQGRTKQFFLTDGRLDDKKLAFLCQNIVYETAYSPQRFNSFFVEKLKDKTNKINYIYKKEKMKFLNHLAFFIPNNKGWDRVKQMQQKLFETNKKKIENLFGISYENFISSRNTFKLLSQMEHLTPFYKNKIILNASNAEETKLALDAGADVNAKDNFGNTALMNADTLEKAKLLIDAGADVNAKDNFGNTALMNADTLEKAKLLIDAGADVNAKDNFGNTALMNADTLEKAKLLIDAGADVNAKDNFGNTVLMNADTLEKAKLLIDAGADVNAKDNFGNTVLMNADTLEKAKLLVAAGAKMPNKFNKKLTQKEIEEIKLFKETLEQDTNITPAQKIAQLKNSLKSKSNQKNSTPTTETQSPYNSSPPTWSTLPPFNLYNNKGHFHE